MVKQWAPDYLQAPLSNLGGLTTKVVSFSSPVITSGMQGAPSPQREGLRVSQPPEQGPAPCRPAPGAPTAEPGWGQTALALLGSLQILLL